MDCMCPWKNMQLNYQQVNKREQPQPFYTTGEHIINCWNGKWYRFILKNLIETHGGDEATSVPR